MNGKEEFKATLRKVAVAPFIQQDALISIIVE